MSWGEKTITHILMETTALDKMANLIEVTSVCVCVCLCACEYVCVTYQGTYISNSTYTSCLQSVVVCQFLKTRVTHSTDGRCDRPYDVTRFVHVLNPSSCNIFHS